MLSNLRSLDNTEAKEEHRTKQRSLSQSRANRMQTLAVQCICQCYCCRRRLARDRPLHHPCLQGGDGSYANNNKRSCTPERHAIGHTHGQISTNNILEVQTAVQHSSTVHPPSFGSGQKSWSTPRCDMHEQHSVAIIGFSGCDW
jgi:hypothetical protein